MGTYRKGILGSFSGKVGTVVGSTWNGIDYMRSLPRPSGKAPTDLQLIQRVKLALATGFLRPISSLVNIGFKSQAVKQTGFNVATSLLITEAISGAYPDFSIEFEKVLISKGNLTGAWNVGISSAVAGQLEVTWTNNSGSGTAKDTDKAVILVYNEIQSQYVFTLDGADRQSGTDVLNLPADFAGDMVQVWIAFIAADKKTISTSIHAGSVVIS
ncbi:MAG: DUF6266 family protein [Daejeonella sp.]